MIAEPAPLRATRSARRVVLLGAAGRDFHNFNVVFRENPEAKVVAFTASQIPGIAGRRYPAALAGPLYPDGIPIVDEAELEELCRDHDVNEVVFAYSDVAHEQAMHLASRALAAGADSSLLGPRRTMLQSALPVIAVTAVRTGCGKSAIARWLSRRLRDQGRKVAVLRHPMPYGDLLRERVQRFASLADLDDAGCTVEEREEYEPHIAVGNIVFAGVDYAAILTLAEREADVIVWDGGNNDFPFIRSDLHIAVADALRPRQIATHHPGEAVARMADLLVVNKVDVASPEDVQTAIDGLRAVNPATPISRVGQLLQRRLNIPRLKVAAVGGGRYEARVRELVAGFPRLAAIADPLLAVRRVMRQQLAVLHKMLLDTVRGDPVCRRLMTAPGVGAVVALTYRATVDQPQRFVHSRAVGAHVGLTPKRYQSGEIDYDGGVSKCGDALLRTMLYEAAHSMLTHSGKWSWLKAWGIRVAQRRGIRRAIVAVARRLAVVLHRMWVDGTEFRWKKDNAAVPAVA